MTKKQIADILKQCRIDAGFTQMQASDAIGRKQQTLASWETAQSQPDANTLFQLCDLYGVSVDDAFGYTKHSVDLTKSEIEMIKKYRSLDARGKETVNKIIDEQANYISDSSAIIADDMANTIKAVGSGINQRTGGLKK